MTEYEYYCKVCDETWDDYYYAKSHGFDEHDEWRPGTVIGYREVAVPEDAT